MLDHSHLIFIESQPEQCKSIVVDIFKDKISESGESLEEKNRKVAVQLDTYVKGNVAVYKVINLKMLQYKVRWHVSTVKECNLIARS